ncbi:hypothetical protein KUCAC02_029417 [Chaenocephalus aceratus]|nr:hypothetical protein KUCAC02_031352 [Chaenocephalus aceratus]KAI4796148.1 hypothetical protein KUCAC02_029417 [Chaenocephalus aceratus]
MKSSRPPAANSRRNQREQGSLRLRPLSESTPIFHFIHSMTRHTQTPGTQGLEEIRRRQGRIRGGKAR